MSEAKFPKGFFMDKAREGSPDFVRGRISIKVEEAIETLNEYKNEAGYVNLDILRSKDGSKLYLTVNDWKPEKKEDDRTEDQKKLDEQVQSPF